MRNQHKQIPLEVAASLAGRRVLIIGGNRRPDQLDRLQLAFPSTEFIWVPTRDSDASLDGFLHIIVKPEVALVLILHGLARTAHTKGARRTCSQIHKPLLWCRRPTAAAVVRALTGPRAAA